MVEPPLRGARRQDTVARPPGRAVMWQTWLRLLFIHWPLDRKVLRPLVPEDLEVDTFDGRAWIGLVPFTMRGIRHPWLPALPGLSAMHELNVRSYVRFRGVRGVWFLSLDAAHPLMVQVARTLYHLPYYRARMNLSVRGARTVYSSQRTHRGACRAHFAAEWESGERLPQALPGSLEHFLTERYSLFTAHRGTLYQGRIDHPPWPLCQARLLHLRSSMLESQGLRVPPQDALLHYAEQIRVEIWPLRRVGRLRDSKAWRTGVPMGT